MIPPPPRSTLFPHPTLFRSAYPMARTHEKVRYSPKSERTDLTPTSAAKGVEDALKILEGRWKLESVLNTLDRKSTRLNSSHQIISNAVFCLKKKKEEKYSMT